MDRRDTTRRQGKTFDHAYVGLTERLSREQHVDGAGNVTQSSTYDYDSGLRRQGQTTATAGGTTSYRSYALDANGSVEGLEGDTGALAPNDTYNYDPYGELDTQTGMSDAASAAPFRFQGFYSDSAVKTYDMQARSYRPDIGRFLSQDRFEAASADVALQSDPLTQNRYAFAGGNPVNNVEFDGHDPIESYRNGCDNTYGSDERCKGERPARQKASASAPDYVFSNNWKRGRDSSPQVDKQQAAAIADAANREPARATARRPEQRSWFRKAVDFVNDHTLGLDADPGCLRATLSNPNSGCQIGSLHDNDPVKAAEGASNVSLVKGLGALGVGAAVGVIRNKTEKELAEELVAQGSKRGATDGAPRVTAGAAADKGRRLAAGKVAAFDKAGVEYTEHFATRITQRGPRGISGQNALDAYNRGTRFYDPATQSHIRYDRQTGVAVVMRGGRAHTVFEQPRPNSRWNPERFGSGN